ncbi:MAG: hypothetical protein JWL96_4671 [Sphingomonas bacterium]|jgi:hypothetical protein|nr:hypothetical protein [Sphingomonas bacterium]MDB5712601.1 hypothetical protein [Sphingomonas bacterium]
MTMKAIDLALVRIASFTCTALLLAACAQGPMTMSGEAQPPS